MKKEAIIGMLKELTKELDYDQHKALFYEECQEDPDIAAETTKQLVKIVEKHVERDKWQRAADVFK